MALMASDTVYADPELLFPNSSLIWFTKNCVKMGFPPNASRLATKWDLEGATLGSCAAVLGCTEGAEVTVEPANVVLT